MQTLLHFARRDDTSGLFSQIAQKGNASRYAMQMATLEPMDAALRAGVGQWGVPCRDFGARNKNMADYLRAAVTLARHLRRSRVQILHNHFYYPSLVGGLGGALARVPVRVTTRHHADYHSRMVSAGFNRHVFLDQLITRLHHRVIAVSHATAHQLLQVEGAPAHKVVVIPNGIDLDTVRVSSAERVAALRAEFGGDDRLLILVAARLAEEKGVDVLLRALPELQQVTAQPFLVLHAGEGPLLGEYQELLSRLGLSHMVRFLGFRRDLPDLMAAADLLVVPSRSEAFGLVAAEALALERPVVASAVGGLPEIVEDQVSGLLVPAEDSAALARAVAALMDDASRRTAMGLAGSQSVRTQYTFEAMLTAYEGLYAQLSPAEFPVPVQGAA